MCAASQKLMDATVIEIIPGILVKSEEEFRERLRAVEALVPWVQLDIADGKFTPNVTWGDPDVVASLDTNVRFEIDLMVEDNEAAVEKWMPLAGRVGRIYFHQEPAQGKERELIRCIRDSGIEVGVSQSPETAVSELFPYAEEIDAVLFHAGRPGYSGQQLHENTIGKIEELHKNYPETTIEIDIGVKKENAARLARAGATRLVTSSFIFEHSNGPAAAIDELKEAAG